MPLTRRVQVFISQEASEALDGLLAALDQKNPKSLIERLLLDRWRGLNSSIDTKYVAVGPPIVPEPGKEYSLNGAAHDRTTERIDDDPEAESKAREVRKEKKEARTIRKNTLKAAVRKILPEPKIERTVLSCDDQGNTIVVPRPHNFHSGTNPISGCVECAKLVTKESK